MAMNLLVVALFVSIFGAEYFARKLAVIPPHFTLVPEMLSAIAVVAIVCKVLSGRRWQLDKRYVLFLALYSFVILFGFLAQAVPTGAVVAGLRSYFKFLPFFLLPAIHPFTARDLKLQLVCLLALLLVQSPLAVYQRFVQFAASMHTGDPIAGMTTHSGVLSLLMISGIVPVVAFYLRKKISFPMMLVLVGALFLPTTLNETKSTLLLLPVAVLLPAWFMPRGARSLRRLVPLVAVGIVAGMVFVTVYDRLIQHGAPGYSLESFFEEDIDRYLYTGAAEGRRTWIGRFDAIMFALEGIGRDPWATAFGLGAGNVSESFLPGFEGTYASYYKRYGADATQVAGFLWEIGLLGILTYLYLYFLAWRDASFLARSDDKLAVLGQVWATVTVIMAAGLVYTSIFAVNEVGYLFWYFCGVTASRAYAVRRARRAAAAAAAAAGRDGSTPWPAGAAAGYRRTLGVRPGEHGALRHLP
ncbi:MAG TPA: hypothetical protein VIN61_01020 [Gammaproteobacteria bacterium]